MPVGKHGNVADEDEERRNTELCPYGLPWLDSFYQQTLLPNGPWSAKIFKSNRLLNEIVPTLGLIYPILCEHIAQNLGRQLDYPERKQMIFELLGPEFVRVYFPNDHYRPELLAPPKMTTEARKKLQLDAQNWLQHLINRIASETGCQRLAIFDSTGGQQSEEMQQFVQHSRQLVKSGLYGELSRLEEKALSESKDVDWRIKKDISRDVGAVIGREPLASTRQSVTKSILKKQAAESARQEKSAYLLRRKDAYLIPGAQSNLLGESIKVILRKDPRRFAQVVHALHGQPLPSSLRTYIWMDVMLRHERDKIDNINLEVIVRDRFAKAVTRGMSELKLTRPAHSPISGLIDNAVIEIYDRTPSMRGYADDEVHSKETTHAVNVLYVYDRTYEPYLIYWLFPLQLTFADNKGRSEHAIELALYLDLFKTGCFPKWPEIYATADRVMSRLAKDDSVFHKHLKTISQINPTVNPKEFLVHLIHQEKFQAEEILQVAALSSSDEMSSALLAEPILFIRKWIGEAFVSVLDIETMMFVWDQCFMQRWKSTVLEDFCLAFLLLLRSRFMSAKDYSSMKRVFLHEPCKLYTLDVQRAWRHIQSNKNLKQVPAMNRMHTRLDGDDEDDKTDATSLEGVIDSRHHLRTPSPVGPVVTVRDTFDVYIDGVTNIPDSATIIKVTGRIIRGSSDGGRIPDIFALPELASSARSPQFMYRQVINENNAAMDHRATLFLRVYTVAINTGQLVVIGNCAFDLYNKTKKTLCVGNFTRALRHGMPNVNNADLHGGSFDLAPKIPACQIYFRILEHERAEVSAPALSDAHYITLDTPLTASEDKLFSTYLADKQFPPTVSDMIRYLQVKEGAQDRDKPVMEWLKNRLDVTIHIHPGQLPTHLPLAHIVRYRQEIGLALHIAQAFGLPEGLFMQCSAVIVSGTSTADFDQSKNGSVNLMTSMLKLDSLQTAPQWDDDATLLYPRGDNHTCLLVTIHGIDVMYRPHPSHSQPGDVTRRSGLPLTSLGRDTQIGWAVVPLFDNGYTITGEHHVPIFKGQPSTAFLKSLATSRLSVALQSLEDIKQASASLVVNIWDGHFVAEEFPELPRHDSLLDAVGNKEEYLRAERQFSSKYVFQFVFDGLTRKEQNLGMSSPVYQQELKLFQIAMDKIFYKLQTNA